MESSGGMADMDVRISNWYEKQDQNFGKSQALLCYLYPDLNQMQAIAKW